MWCECMLRIQSLNRYSAFGIHLLVSATVVGLSAILVFLFWYPNLLAYVSGVYNVFLMLLLIDVVLGPLITLIVFNTAKKELRRDLAIVGCVQIAALVYGLHIFFSVRPVFIVFNSDRFDVVYANELSAEKLKQAASGFQSLPLWGPEVIAARLPNEKEAANAIVISAVAGGEDVQQMPQYYFSYDALRQDVIKVARPLSLLKEFNKKDLVKVERLIGSFSAKSAAIGYLPLVGKLEKVTVIVDLKTAEILEMNKLQPLDVSFGADAIDLKSVLKRAQ